MLRILIAMFSAGWLLPLWLSANSMFTFFNVELWPRLRGENPLNSFPFVHFSERAFTVSCVWLAAVIVFWTWRLGRLTKPNVI
jgi:hypothetical protein